MFTTYVHGGKILWLELNLVIRVEHILVDF